MDLLPDYRLAGAPKELLAPQIGRLVFLLAEQGDLGPPTKSFVELRAVDRRLIQNDGRTAGTVSIDGIIHLWDWRYFDNILRKKTYAVDDEEVRDYFPTNVVVERMLQLYQTILGLSFREIENPLTWHPSVKLYEVTNTGSTEPIGYFYLDLFPREGKYPQAETAALVTGRRRLDGSYQKPVSALIANVRNATNTRPSLLSHKEIVVLFHEFGHIMHHTLCKNKYGRLTAFNVSSDFIETPSQMMENWTWDRDILEFLSGHYKDQSQKIPRDMSEKIVAARYTGVGLNTLMQLSLALIDLTYHGPSVPRDPSKAFAKTFSDTALIPLSPGTHPEGQFGHIMDGYDAGYYGYLWSSVYAQDMFSIFKKYGLRDITIGRRYREEILEPGATRDDMQSLKSFLGREPDQKSFYESIGLAL
jgi:thimet oligopeptidase